MYTKVCKSFILLSSLQISNQYFNVMIKDNSDVSKIAI